MARSDSAAAPSGGGRTVLAHLSSAGIGADRGQDARLRCV